MRGLFLAPLTFLKLLYQSVHLALGQIWANKTRSVLTTIGIVIGVASVVAVIAALTGLKAKVLSKVETFGSDSIHIWPRRPDTGPLSRRSWDNFRFSPKELEGMLEHCPSVGRYCRVNTGQHETVRCGEKSVRRVHIRGVEPAWHEIENRPILFGRKLSIVDESRQACLIGPLLRDKLRLDKDCVGENIRIGHTTFRIVGVIERRTDMGFGGGGWEYYEVIVPFRTAEQFGIPTVSALAEARSTQVLDEAVAEIEFFLRRTRRLKPGDPDTFRVESLKSALKMFNELALIVTLVASGIVGISLLVGGVGIMNIMFVSISERTREIGLRKAVGAKQSAILTQFLVEAVILCFVGGAVGVAVGHLLTMVISSIHPLLEKTYVPAWAIVLSFGFAGAVGICFGMFPAIKAARLDPIEALRHE